MPKPRSFSEKTMEELNKFRKDLSLVVVGLFLALGIQSIIQFVEVIVPHISAYYYLGLGVISLILVLVFLNRAADYAGLKEQIGLDKEVS
jgi:hypothetical protein